MKLCVLDLETTGLEPILHQVWEIGLIVRDGTAQDEYLWRLKPELARADPAALAKNWFYARTAGMPAKPASGAVNLAALPSLAHRMVLRFDDNPILDTFWSNPSAVGAILAPLLDGAVVVGANPGFDKDFIRPFLRQHGQAYTAHYRPVCVTTLAAGFLFGKTAATPGNDLPAALEWPWSSNAISAEVGVNPADYDRHTALDDCRWALAQLNAITGDTYG